MKMKTIAQDRSKLGFIGIGAMGLRIAGRLLKQGFCVTGRLDRRIGFRLGCRSVESSE
jgi:NAD binding domain of 6-phosphogluconate dehydrogenase